VWSSTGTIWIAGDASILRCSSAITSGSVCAAETVTGSGPIYGLWGTSATNAFAVGANGRILHYDGKSWSSMQSPTGARLSRVWGSSANDVWAIGDTTAVHYNGTTWTLMTNSVLSADNRSQYFIVNPAGAFEIGLWGTGAGEVYAATWFGEVLRTGGSSFWGEMTGPPEVNNFAKGRIVGIGGTPGGCAIAVTDGLTGSGGPILLRGVGPTGCLAGPMTGPATWP
jgi:hypothetical protein